MPNDCLTFRRPPIDFAPKVEVASCYCEFEDKLLLVKRHPDKSHGNTWGVPAGKLELGEDPKTAIVRELYEEIGVRVPKEDLYEIGRLFVRIPTLDFIYHMFRTKFKTLPSIVLELQEHTEAQWVTFEEAIQMPLMPGEKDTLSYYKEVVSRSL